MPVDVDDIWFETERDRRRVAETGLPSGYQRECFEYWAANRVGGDLPMVSAIDPLLLPRTALPWVDLISVEGTPRRFTIRLWGTGIVDAVGRDLSGVDMEVEEMHAGIRRLTAVIEQRKPYFATIPMDWHSERYKHGHLYTSLGLPFQEPDGRISRILCLLSFE